MSALLQRLLQSAAASEEESYFDDNLHDADPLALILPRITGLISLLAVCCVFVEAGLDLHESVEEIVDLSLSQKHQQLTSHVQVFYQIPLLFFSMAFVWGTSPVPSSVDVWGAYGNTTTCTAQGFMLQFGLFGSLAWDAVLSITLLRMAQGKTKSRLWLYHCLVWPMVLAVSVYPLTQDMYRFNYNLCWINNENHDDEDTYEDGESFTQGQADIWHGVTTLLAMMHLIFSVVIMICLYRSIQTNEKLLNGSSARTEESNATGEPPEDSSMMRYQAFKEIASQGMFYTASVVLIALPGAVYMILFNATGLWSSGLSSFAVTLTPLVGYVNFVVFMKFRRLEDCHTGYARLLKRLHSCCSCGRNHKNQLHSHNAPREVIPTTAAIPEESQSTMDKQKVIAVSRDGQLDAQEFEVVVGPPTSFLGGIWNQLAGWWTDNTDQSVAASDCGVILQTKQYPRRRRMNTPPHSVMGDRSADRSMDRSHSVTERASNIRELQDFGRSQRTVTTTPFDQHDSFPSQATPPSMPVRVASEAFSANESESFRESSYESQSLTLSKNSSYVDAAPPTRPVRYETDHSTFGAESTYGGESTCGPESTVASFNFPDASTLGEEASSYAGENSTFGGESTLATEFADSVQQAIVIEYHNRNTGTTPPSKPVRYDTDADESAVSSAEEKAPRQPLRYDTCSEKDEESEMEESLHTKVSGAPAWARHILRQVKHSEGGAPPSKPTRYDSEVESVLTSVAGESVLTSLAGDALDVPDLEATGQVMPPDWAIQYLRKVAKSEQSHATASQASVEVDEKSAVEVGLHGPPLYEVVANKNGSKNAPKRPFEAVASRNAPNRPLRYHSDVSEQSSFA